MSHLLVRNEQNKNQIAIQFKDGERWRQYSWHEYFRLIESAGAAFIQHNLGVGDRAAIIANSCLEWAIADLALLGIGAVTVPIYPNNLIEDIEYIINNSEAKIVILEKAEHVTKWELIKDNCPTVTYVVVMHPEKNLKKNYVSWRELLSVGRNALINNPHIYFESAKQITLNQTATLLYTSGTTGQPKGVMLAHEQIMSELIDVFSLVEINHEDVSLSFLPYSHILGRIELWGNVYAGYVLSFAESVDKLRDNLIEVRPTFLIAVPRIFEKIYAGILARVENSKLKNKIFTRAFKIGLEVSQKTMQKQPLGLELSFEYEIARQLVFKNVLAAFGGRIRYAVSGGAALNKQIAQFFHGLGLLIIEGYGLTETTAAISFNSPLHYKFGTVGRPLSDVKIKIAADGEVLVKSKKVMKHYYKNPQATAEAMEDGFFKTGDIGHIDEDGYLNITDRKKDLIKTAGGKYVAPQKLEALLKSHPAISNVLIHGDQKKYIVALIVLNLPYRNSHDSHETYNLIKNAVAEANSKLASFESIKKFFILPNDFTVETGELTPSLKVKRRYCDQKFHKEIADLY